MLIERGRGLRRTHAFVDGGLDKKGYEMHGEGVLNDLGQYLKSGVTRGFKSGKKLLPGLVKHLAPSILAYGSSQLAKAAAERGAPDMAVNAISSLGQKAAQHVASSKKGPKLSSQQEVVSNFINNQSEKLLHDLLAKRGAGLKAKQAGSGVRNFGEGVRNFGEGASRGSGSAFLEQSPKKISQ